MSENRVETLLLAGMMALFLGIETGKAQALNNDCSGLAGAARKSGNKTIGVQKCTIFEETAFQNAGGVAYDRIEVGLQGTIEGYAVKSGLEMYHFPDYPEFVLAQKGNLGPYLHGTSEYSGEKGKSGLTLFLPKQAAGWNGKLFMIFHGGAMYPPIGDLLPRPARYNPLMGANEYVGLMIERGYAVVYTRRSASAGRPGDRDVVLDDGTLLKERTHGYHVGLLRDWTILAKNFVESRLGRKPQRTYWYGRSAGAAPGRLINYIAGANTDTQGKRLFDGFILDDPAGGFFWPTLKFARVDNKDGSFSVKADEQDRLLFDDSRKAAFAPQLDTLHQNYSGPRWVATTWGGDYPTLKRINATLLREKGLGAKNRLYEIMGVSHGDAGAHHKSARWEENLDLTPIFDALVDVLDQWVERGMEPPPTQSDVLAFGDVNGDGVNENPAIALPEIACPTGVYYEYPARAGGGEGAVGAGRTGFAAFLEEARPAVNADTMKLPAGFDEAWLEPLDSRGRFVDMNSNNVRDTRESITQAWRRRGREGRKYGTLRYDETLTQGAYASCVARAASELYNRRLISEGALLQYLQQAVESVHFRGALKTE